MKQASLAATLLLLPTGAFATTWCVPTLTFPWCGPDGFKASEAEDIAALTADGYDVIDCEVGTNLPGLVETMTCHGTNPSSPTFLHQSVQSDPAVLLPSAPANATATNGLTAAQKSQYAQDASQANAAAITLGAAGTAFCPFAGTYVTLCTLTTAFSAGALALLAQDLTNLAADPSDPNYTVLATPSPQPIPDGVLATQLATDATTAESIAAALYTTYNRISGALDASQPTWVQQQLRYSLSLSSDLFRFSAAIPNDITAFSSSIQNLAQPVSEPSALFILTFGLSGLIFLRRSARA